METRKITVLETKNQKKSVIMSAATTLGELKADLRANNIDYTDMAFYEGVSKIELKTDDSVLPHDVPYKGQTTNELVFMLTNTNKKIKSGTMTRIEAYTAIKSMNLQDACVKQLGKNFTMCKTADLINLIEEYKNKVQESVNTTTECKCNCDDNHTCVDVQAREAITTLVQILYNIDIIDDLDNKEVLSLINDCITDKTKTQSPYSSDELDEMFSDMISH